MEPEEEDYSDLESELSESSDEELSEELASLEFVDDDDEDEDDIVDVIDTIDTQIVGVDDLQVAEIQSTQEALATVPAITRFDNESNYTNVLPSFTFDDLEDELINVEIIGSNDYKQINKYAMYQDIIGIEYPPGVKERMKESVPQIPKNVNIGTFKGLGQLPDIFVGATDEEIMVPINPNLPEIRQYEITKLPPGETKKVATYKPRPSKYKNAPIELPSGSTLLDTTNKISDIDITSKQALLSPNLESRKKIYTLVKININRVSTSTSVARVKSYTVSELKGFLKDLGIQSSGSKSDLVKRLRAEYSKYMA
jgi:hypothetical protein